MASLPSLQPPDDRPSISTRAHSEMASARIESSNRADTPEYRQGETIYRSNGPASTQNRWTAQDGEFMSHERASVSHSDALSLNGELISKWRRTDFHNERKGCYCCPGDFSQWRNRFSR